MQITVKVDVKKSEDQKEYAKFKKFQEQHEATEKKIAKLYNDLEKLIIKKSVLENTMELFFD